MAQIGLKISLLSSIANSFAEELFLASFNEEKNLFFLQLKIKNYFHFEKFNQERQKKEKPHKEACKRPGKPHRIFVCKSASSNICNQYIEGLQAYDHAPIYLDTS